MPRTAPARREEGAYRRYSTDEQRYQAGWIGGRKWAVTLAWALGSNALHGRREVGRYPRTARTESFRISTVRSSWSSVMTAGGASR